MTFGHQATDWDPGSDADESEAPLYDHSNPRLSYLRITRENKTGLILASGIGLIFASASAPAMRQTTLARSLLDRRGQYLNWDITKDRKVIRELAWPKDASLVVLDELHKAPKWKNLVKGGGRRIR